MLDDVAKVLQISNWHDVCKSPLLAAMRKAGDHAIWVDKSSGWLPKGDKGLTAAESWWALKDARAAVLGMMATVQANVAAGKPGLRGLAKDSLLLQLLAKAGQLRTGEPWFTRDLVVWPVELTEELVDGVKLYPLDAVVAGLLKLFLDSGGWAYLIQCAGCGIWTVKKKPGGLVCGSERCKKRWQRRGLRL